MTWLNDSQTLQQGSAKWHDYRRLHIGASDVPAIMGTCDFRKPYDIFLSKMPDYVPDQSLNTSWPIVRGRSLEPVILAKFEQIHGCKLTQPTIGKNIFHASLDGLWLEDKAIVETKAPALWKHTMALCGLVPTTYVDQLQAQMYCADLEKNYYVSFHDGEPESHQYAEVLVCRDEKRIKEIIETCEVFWEKVLRREW